MDQLGLLGQSGLSSQTPGAEALGKFPLAAIPQTRERVRFPGDDNHKSLAQMAKSDLEAALQLLVDRAKYITGASGAAIALVENGKMVCRASAGASAPEIGAYLQMDSGLTGESVRLKKLLRCDDVETDLRVNRESCRALGIVSVVVQPLVHDEKVIGIFELLSGKAYAFEERDINAVERLGEIIQTALEVEPDIGLQDTGIQNWPLPPSDAGNLVRNNAAQAEKSRSAQSNPTGGVLSVPGSDPVLDSTPVVAIDPEIVAHLHASIGKCTACGFPVSGGRSLCLDCEASNVSEGARPVSAGAPSFLDHYSDPKPGSWFGRNIYWIGIVIMSLATVALLALKSR
ncbi:MAG TPA: GAF domain-containing protein [Terriglobales bacterium]|jgi:putative methionine-R-sulfoxide reductase with GAF domain